MRYDELEGAMLADGFEDAILGVAYRACSMPVVAYDYHSCIEILVDRDGMSWSEALDYFEFNVVGAFVGEGTPVFIERDCDD